MLDKETVINGLLLYLKIGQVEGAFLSELGLHYLTFLSFDYCGYQSAGIELCT